MGGIHYGFVEGQPLALMDGYGPRQSERNLLEGAFGGLFDFARRGEGVFHPFPHGASYLDVFATVAGLHHHGLSRQRHYAPKHAIIILVIARDVILDKHHLGPLLQSQRCIGRVSPLRKIAAYLGCEGERGRLQGGKTRLIDGVGAVVVGGEADVLALVTLDEGLVGPAVEALQGLLVGPVVAYAVKDIYECLVILAEDLGELHHQESGLLQSVALEEVG